MNQLSVSCFKDVYSSFGVHKKICFLDLRVVPTTLIIYCNNFAIFLEKLAVDHVLGAPSGIQGQHVGDSCFIHLWTEVLLRDLNF